MPSYCINSYEQVSPHVGRLLFIFTKKLAYMSNRFGELHRIKSTEEVQDDHLTRMEDLEGWRKKYPPLHLAAVHVRTQIMADVLNLKQGEKLKFPNTTTEEVFEHFQEAATILATNQEVLLKLPMKITDRHEKVLLYCFQLAGLIKDGVVVGTQEQFDSFMTR